jgi:hypothetical protein
VRWWLGTFALSELTSHAYDFGVWTFGWLRVDMNYPDVETLTEEDSAAPSEASPVALPLSSRRAPTPSWIRTSETTSTTLTMIGSELLSYLS